METAIWLNRQSNLQLVIRSQEQNFSLISSQLKKKNPSAPMWHIIFLQDEWTFSYFFFPWYKIRSAETNQSSHGLGKELGFRFNFSPSCFHCEPSPPAWRRHVANWTAGWRRIWKSYIYNAKSKSTISRRIALWMPVASLSSTME